MKDKEIEAIRKRAKLSTAGPFHVERRDDECGGFTFIVHGAKDYAWCKDELDMRARFNAEFIAHAQQDVIRLIDYIYQLENTIEELSMEPTPEQVRK